jgi:phosphoserine phosphatase
MVPYASWRKLPCFKTVTVYVTFSTTATMHLLYHTTVSNTNLPGMEVLACYMQIAGRCYTICTGSAEPLTLVLAHFIVITRLVSLRCLTNVNEQ